jgi:hypothetical protein
MGTGRRTRGRRQAPWSARYGAGRGAGSALPVPSRTCLMGSLSRWHDQSCRRDESGRTTERSTGETMQGESQGGRPRLGAWGITYQRRGGAALRGYSSSRSRPTSSRHCCTRRSSSRRRSLGLTRSLRPAAAAASFGGALYRLSNSPRGRLGPRSTRSPAPGAASDSARPHERNPAGAGAGRLGTSLREAGPRSIPEGPPGGMGPPASAARWARRILRQSGQRLGSLSPLVAKNCCSPAVKAKGFPQSLQVRVLSSKGPFLSESDFLVQCSRTGNGDGYPTLGADRRVPCRFACLPGPDSPLLWYPRELPKS